MYDMTGTYYFAPSDEMRKQAAYDLCRDGAPFQSMCANLLYLMVGWNSKQTNETMLPVQYSHAPAGASVRNQLHFAQIIRGGYFRKYDFGSMENIRRYGQMIPPLYRFVV